MYVTISSDGSALRREPGGLGFKSPVELFFFFRNEAKFFFFFSEKKTGNVNKKTQDIFSRPRKKYVKTYEIRAVTARQTYVFIFFIRGLEKKS